MGVMGISYGLGSARHYQSIAAPTLTGSLPDIERSADGSALAVETMSLFSGAIATFSMDGPPGVVIDTATGVVTIPADQPYDAAPVVVWAINAGGSSEPLVFAVTQTLQAGAGQVKGFAQKINDTTLISPSGVTGDTFVIWVQSQGQGAITLAAGGHTPLTDVATMNTQGDNNTAQVFHFTLTQSTTGLSMTATGPGAIVRMSCVNIGPHAFVSAAKLAPIGTSDDRAFPTLSNIPPNSLIMAHHSRRVGWLQCDIVGPSNPPQEPALPASEATYSYNGTLNMTEFLNIGPAGGTTPPITLTVGNFTQGIGNIIVAFEPIGGVVAGALPGQYIANDNGVGKARSSTLQDFAVEDVTFTASTQVQVGHYLTGNIGLGDLWIKPTGASAQISWTPAPGAMVDGRSGNGAMLNVQAMTEGDAQGFDAWSTSVGPVYSASAASPPPVTLVPGDVLVVAKSRGAGTGNQMIENFIFIHCVDEVPDEDEFAPPYIWHASLGPRPRLRYSDIAEGTIPALSTSGFTKGIPSVATMGARFTRRLFDPIGIWKRYTFKADRGGNTYGRDYQNDIDQALATIVSDLPIAQKRKLIQALVQRGIDAYGALRSAYAQGLPSWLYPDGGHHGGRAPLITIAGHLLGDITMRDWIKTNTSPTAVTGIHEQAMRCYLTPEVVALTQEPGWQGSGAKGPGTTHNPYETPMADAPAVPEWVGSPAIGGVIPAWNINNLWNGNDNFYRIVGHAEVAAGQTIALLAMGLRTAWGHDAYFDYHARFHAMEQYGDDPWRYVNGVATARYARMPDAPAGTGSPVNFAREMYDIHAFKGGLYSFPAGVNAFYGAM